jgi:hypothetical protein
MNSENQIIANIDLMNKSASDGTGMDIVIVSTGSSKQVDFWEKRLEATRGRITKTDAVIIAVQEDWEGGAGNGLGTLYAIKKADEKARATCDTSVLDRLRNGAAIGLYHTAGKGTRLAPLPGSENNNKSGVKLPGLISVDGTQRPITILEAVIKQTSIYASSRNGRISVFWGDQIFVPSTNAAYTPGHHADILCRLGPMPGESEWGERGLRKYGLITVNREGDAFQVEKVDFKTVEKLIGDGLIGVEKGVGVSLGSFSMSAELTDMLLMEFGNELEKKDRRMDSDPHFWMPLTLDRATYSEIMNRKGVDKKTSGEHHQRMQDLRENLQRQFPDLKTFGAVDTGADSYWWDYGRIRVYKDNVLKTIDPGNEGDAMRKFFGIQDRRSQSETGNGLTLDDNSIVLGCKVNIGNIKNSLLIGVDAGSIEVENCVIISATAPSIKAESSLLYNIANDGGLALEPETVRVDSFIPYTHHYPITTKFDRDGGEDWGKILPDNEFSYEDIYRMNQNIDISQAEAFEEIEHARIKNTIFKTIW